MTLRPTPARLLLGTATIGIVLSVASVAWACVPNVNNSKFTVKDAATGQDAMSGKTGQRMRAVGQNIQMPGWEYTVKLVSSWYNHGVEQWSYNGRCGEFGTVQTVVRTDGFYAPRTELGGDPKGYWSFNQEFTLDATGQQVGPAHFCAIPTPVPAGSFATSGTTGATEMYIYSPGTSPATGFQILPGTTII